VDTEQQSPVLFKRPGNNLTVQGSHEESSDSDVELTHGEDGVSRNLSAMIREGKSLPLDTQMYQKRKSNQSQLDTWF